MKCSTRKAQATLEIVLFITLFASALMLMSGYLRGALQGNWKRNIDSFSDEQFDEDTRFAENGADIVRIKPKVSVDMQIDGSIDQSIGVDRPNSAAGFVRLNNWGTYSN